jgi:hypothetical protein
MIVAVTSSCVAGGATRTSSFGSVDVDGGVVFSPDELAPELPEELVPSRPLRSLEEPPPPLQARRVTPTPRPRPRKRRRVEVMRTPYARPVLGGRA